MVYHTNEESTGIEDDERQLRRKRKVGSADAKHNSYANVSSPIQVSAVEEYLVVERRSMLST